MRAERNDNGDAIYFLVLCPKCKCYSRIHSIMTEILSGTNSFWCYSDKCKGSTVLKIIAGFAVDINRPAKADIKTDPPRYEPISTEAFTKQRNHTN